MVPRGVWFTALLLTVVLTASACHKKPPIARPTPPPPTGGIDGTGTSAGAPANRCGEPTIVPPEPVRDEAVSSASLDDLNRNSPLEPVFFELDSSDLSTEGQRILDGNAAVLKQHATWTITIEGHCDERGSAEYNLALGERRALSARAYLVSLGLRPIGCARSATAKNFRSIRDTTSPRTPRIAARTS